LPAKDRVFSFQPAIDRDPWSLACPDCGAIDEGGGNVIGCSACPGYVVLELGAKPVLTRPGIGILWRFLGKRRIDTDVRESLVGRQLPGIRQDTRVPIEAGPGIFPAIALGGGIIIPAAILVLRNTSVDFLRRCTKRYIST